MLHGSCIVTPQNESYTVSSYYGDPSTSADSFTCLVPGGGNNPILAFSVQAVCVSAQ